MTRNNEDFFAGRDHEQPEGGTTYIHGTNVRLNVGDIITPNGDSLLRSGRHGGIYGVEDVADDPRATQPRAWAVPAKTKNISSDNIRHALSYAIRRESDNPTKEKRAYAYQVEPIDKAEKFPSPENEVSSASGFRITKILADVPQDHYSSGHYEDTKGLYLTEHQKGFMGDCAECAKGAIGLKHRMV